MLYVFPASTSVQALTDCTKKRIVDGWATNSDFMSKFGNAWTSLPCVTGMCTGNSDSSEDVDCTSGDGTNAANTQNRGSGQAGTDDATCCEAVNACKLPVGTESAGTACDNGEGG